MLLRETLRKFLFDHGNSQVSILYIKLKGETLWEKELKMPAVYSTNCIHLWYFYIVPGTFYLDCSSCGGSQNKKRKFMRKINNGDRFGRLVVLNETTKEDYLGY